MAHEEEEAGKGKECGVKSEEMVDGAQDKEGEGLGRSWIGRGR